MSRKTPSKEVQAKARAAARTTDKKADAGKESDKPAFDGQRYAKSLGIGPGVYVMRDEAGKALYVGKAKNLRKRVASYFDSRPKVDRIMLMLSHVASMEVSLTRTEAEALLLENDWIKSLRPRYNVLLRDDKSYPYLHLDTATDYPRVAFHRGGQSAPGRYFGPFPSASSVRESLNLIHKLFRLRNCEDSVFQHRSRPCLQYQIKRCTGPCVGLISQADYARDVEDAELFLAGRNEQVIERLVARMQQAAAGQDYEQAAVLRDQIATLRVVQQQQFVSTKDGDVDVLAVASNTLGATVQMVNIRGGRNLGQRSFHPANARGRSPEEVLEAFLGQHYDKPTIPPLILLSHRPESLPLLAEVFSEQAGRKVVLQSRPRGERARWLHQARENAEHVLVQKQAQQSSLQKRFAALAELLELESPPALMECFDISHISGTQTVGSCVVFGPEGPIKSRYRRFNLKGITPGDDYAAMEQVLQRRYSRQVKEGAELPDLVIVDGGQGQLKRAVEVMAELGLPEVPLMGIAKGPARKSGHEEWLLPRPPYSIRPQPDAIAGHLVQQIRDEAHRFAITGHRMRRQKAAGKSTLEDIPGIGGKRRRLLLQHFGGLKGVKKAGVEELSRLPGINRTLAQQIVDHFQGRKR